LVRSASQARAVPNTKAQTELPMENTSEFHSNNLKSENDSKILVKFASVGMRGVSSAGGMMLETMIKSSGGSTR
jgi:hypothetical protein